MKKFSTKQWIRLGIVLFMLICIMETAIFCMRFFYMGDESITPYSVKTKDSDYKVLFVTQKDKFKEEVVSNVIQHYENDDVYFSIIDIRNLLSVNIGEWNKVIIISDVENGEYRPDVKTFIESVGGTYSLLLFNISDVKQMYRKKHEVISSPPDSVDECVASIVKIIDAFVVKIELSQTKKTLSAGRRFTLKAKHTKRKVKWSSSNEDIAEVFPNGEVMAKKEGTATITATINNKQFTCKVTVTPRKKYILFLGNSLLKSGKVLDHLSDMIKKEDLDYEVIDQNMDGMMLKWRLQLYKQTNVYDERDLSEVDYIVFQEYGRKNLNTKSALKQYFKMSNKNVKKYLFETEYDIMFDLRQELKDIKELTFIPSGKVFNDLKYNLLPFEKLITEDGVHPTLLYGYVGALNVYSIITGRNCKELGVGTDYLTNSIDEFLPKDKKKKEHIISEIQKDVWKRVNEEDKK